LHPVGGQIVESAALAIDLPAGAVQDLAHAVEGASSTPRSHSSSLMTAKHIAAAFCSTLLVLGGCSSDRAVAFSEAGTLISVQEQLYMSESAGWTITASITIARDGSYVLLGRKHPPRTGAVVRCGTVPIELRRKLEELAQSSKVQHVGGVATYVYFPDGSHYQVPQAIKELFDKVVDPP
jgi:hypothetical protein